MSDEVPMVRVFSAGVDVPLEAQTIIALRAFGLSRTQIAARTGITDLDEIDRAIDAYDPERVSERGDAVRLLMLKGMMQKVLFESLLQFSPSDLRDLEPGERADIIGKIARAMKSLDAEIVRPDKNEQKALAELKGATD
jgi:hypothetical protein